MSKWQHPYHAVDPIQSHEFSRCIPIIYPTTCFQDILEVSSHIVYRVLLVFLNQSGLDDLGNDIAFNQNVLK